MQITAVTATPVRVPLRAPLRTSLGEARYSHYGVVVIEAGGGTAHGLGEIAMIWHGNGGHLCREVTELIAPAIVGLPVSGRSAIVRAAAGAVEFGRHSLAAVAAIDMAVLDLQGRLAGLPAVELLGGCLRDRVELSMSLSIAATEQVVAEARSYVDAGFHAVKIKSDADVERTLDTTSAIRREFGPLALRVDFNMALRDRKAALRAIELLARYDVASVEQPLPADDLDGAAFLTARSPVPVMLDESVWTEADAFRVIGAQACDMVNIYVSEAGGASAALRTAQLCDAAGVSIAVGSMPELAIGTAAAAAFAFSTRHLDHPSDVSGHLYHEDDVVTHDLRVEDGYLLAPRTPGLGVELDPDRLAYFTQREIA